VTKKINIASTAKFNKWMNMYTEVQIAMYTEWAAHTTFFFFFLTIFGVAGV
jgi:hypothetical protein